MDLLKIKETIIIKLTRYTDVEESQYDKVLKNKQDVEATKRRIGTKLMRQRLYLTEDTDFIHVEVQGHAE